MVHACLFLIQLAACHVYGNLHIRTRFIAGGLDGFHQKVQRRFRIGQVGRKAAFIPDTRGKSFSGNDAF